MSHTTRRARRWSIAAVAAVAIVAVVAVAHAPIARRARAIFGSSGCPFAPSTDVAALERSRRVGVASLRGEGVVTDRALLGFTLGVTTRADLDAWSKRVGVPCSVEAGGALVRCTHVPAIAFAADLPSDPSFGALEINDLVVRLDDRARVVAIDALATTADAATALALVTDAQHRLDARLPRPVDRTGPADAIAFAAGPFAHASITARFANWAVDVGATSRNEPGRITVRWQSRAID